jgi:hypothetical protein
VHRSYVETETLPFISTNTPFWHQQSHTASVVAGKEEMSEGAEKGLTRWEGSSTIHKLLQRHINN